ncbi:SIMPL domain-containing protein [Pontibacter oryzae]|uniref:SIMPL domain-containing protein n=1 Tax=Pontibacter oryzae TaxID=2304593 RepID=A0A399SF83_9BACT|nr:SIMPL domain-containing protein [Pontibacter oryzae]RIJ41858.1 SIMPL domain-containing protein [Pontibacter oryzae]
MNKSNLVAASLVLGVSLIICTLFFTLSLRARDKANQTINVTGSAKRDIVSDLGVLRSNIQANGPTAEAAYKQLLAQRPQVLSYLKSKGFTESSIEFSPINLNPIYEITDKGYSSNRILEYTANQLIEVKAKDVIKIKSVSLDMISLVNQGVNITVMPPEYYYTGLADLKIEIQADAAKDALNRANKIAEATGSDLGSITTARMGVIQITPVNSNMISDYGINDVSSIEKEITAVVSASFRLD